MHHHSQSGNLEKSFETVCLLLEHGADVSQKNEGGKCFIDVVKEASRARAENDEV